MKIQMPPEAAIRSTNSSSRSRFALICATQIHLGIRGNDGAQQRLRAFDVDGEIVVDEKDGDLAALFFARAFNSKSSFTTLSLLRNRMESPKNPVTVQNSHP